MKKYLIWLLFALQLAQPFAFAGTSDTKNVVPSANFSFMSDLQTFLKEEDGERFFELLGIASIVSGGTHATGAGLVGTPASLIAYPGGIRTTETNSITYPDNDTGWVIVHKDTSGNVGSFVRVSGTHYLIDFVSATIPSLPSDSSWLMQVTTSGGAIAAILDLRTILPRRLGEFASLSAAITSIGSTVTTLTVSSLVIVENNVIVPSTLRLRFDDVGNFSVSSGKTVTIDGLFSAECKTIFSGLGTVVLGNLVGVRCAQWNGAVGDGVIDDAASLQRSVDQGGIIDFGGLTYLLSRTIGTNDRWGINIKVDGTVIRNGTFDRFDSDISVVANAYPLILVGVPDNDAGASTDNVIIKNFNFIGENTRHSLAGNTSQDRRHAINVKNTTGFIVRDSTFTLIDSAAIWFQRPDDFDLALSVNYNMTKNYNAKILNNRFIAEPHTTAGRNFMHVIVATGIDGLEVRGNYFEWCDVAMAAGSTYDDIDDLETDTYLGTVGTVKRSGRGLRFIGNRIFNSAEHGIYANSMDMVISNNIFLTTHSTVVGETAIKLTQARNVTVSGNVISGSLSGITLRQTSHTITIVGNSINVIDGSEGGAISLNATGTTAFVDARPFLSVYRPIHNILISGNIITLPEAAQTGLKGSAIRLATKTSSDANFPDFDQIYAINIVGNLIRNARHGVMFIGILIKGVNIDGNSFIAKPFVGAGFASGTTMSTEHILAYDNLSGIVPTAGIYTSFTNNKIDGATYLFGDTGGTGASIHIPRIISGNTITNVKTFKSADLRKPEDINTMNSNAVRQYLGIAYAGLNSIRINVIASGSLLAAGVDQDGKIVIENVGAGDQNIVIYSGGQRFRIDGGAAF